MSNNREVLYALRAAAAARVASAGGPKIIARIRRRRLRRVLAALAKTRRVDLSAAAVSECRLDAVEPTEKSTFLDDVESTFVDRRITKKALLAHIADESLAGELLFERYIITQTSGTSGRMGIFVNDERSWAQTRGLLFARVFAPHLRGRLHRKSRLAFVVATGGHFMTHLLATRMPDMARRFSSVDSLSIELPMPALVYQLHRIQPTLLHSYPTALELLAAEASNGNLRIKPDFITAGSETLSQACRAKIEAAFPSAVLIETYAATECVPMAASCRHGTLHINEDACILEAVDDDLEPVVDGARGERLMLTNLLNTTQPVVRYLLGDQAVIGEAGCACGSPFRSLRVHGRSDDVFYLQDDSDVLQAHSPIPLEVIFLKIAGLAQYQLVHERQNHLQVFFVREASASADKVEAKINERVLRYLWEHGLCGRVDLDIVEVDGLTRNEKSGKIRQILSKVQRSDAPSRPAGQLRERRRNRAGEITCS